MKFLLLFFILASLLFSIENSVNEKHLKSDMRAEVYASSLVDAGSYDEAIEFLKVANKKYTNNTSLLASTAQAYLEKNDLENAKKYFKQVLVLEPKNDTIKMKINFIEEQEAGQENKNVEDIFAFVQDKGLDFLMIFLAFLGGEIFAKRYYKCQKNYIFVLAEHYIERDGFFEILKHRLGLIVKQVFSFCFIINVLIIVTITVVLMVSWLLVAFHYEIAWFIDEPLLTVSAEGLERYLFTIFGLFFVASVTIRTLLHYIHLPKTTQLCEIELVQELDALLGNGFYVDIHDVMNYLKDHGVSRDKASVLLDKYSSDADTIMKFYKDENE